MTYQIVKELPYYVNCMKQIVGEEVQRNSNLKKFFSEVQLIGEKLKDMFQGYLPETTQSEIKD